MTHEEWRNFGPGDRVRVVRGISDTEKTLLGRVFVVKRIDKTHGYVVAGDEYDSGWWLHPEALELLSFVP